jgi:hypothetical protein
MQWIEAITNIIETSILSAIIILSMGAQDAPIKTLRISH